MLADTRENTIQSSQEVYRRLQLRSPDEEKLKFETIALIAVRRDGSLDETKLKDLVRLFRPDRDGSLSMVRILLTMMRDTSRQQTHAFFISNLGRFRQVC
jgi:hypothetical protein